MVSFLRKLLGHQQTHHSPDEETDLEKFFTDSELARQMFEQLITAANLPKRLLVIHGLGGVGKSTLLKMYALACYQHHIAVARVASEETLSLVDVLADWADDLSHDSIALPVFQKTLNHYRAIQAKVEDQSKKSLQAKSEIAGTLGKTVAKTAINMATSSIPMIGPIVGAVGGSSAEAFIDWLHGFLTKPDMELYLDPAKRLDDDFLSDLSRVAAHQRIVLLTDTYEQMTALDDWMRELAKRLPKNVLLVLAGRTVPAWDRSWQDWMGKAEIVELKEMTPDDIRTLVHRYYSYIRSGDPDPKQTEAIVQFARGLPMVATAVVQLWVKYGLEDFPTVRPQVVADLVDRLLEGVPHEVRPAFEAAAVLRYFNVEVLNALLESGNSEALYAELRRWPFIRSRREGLAVHDTMREMINVALHVRTPEHFRMLHERAAAYYEVRIEKATGSERERYTFERLYHRIQADEGSGIQLFQKLAEELTSYRLVNQLRALLNDVNTHPLELENSHLWVEYYNARLAQLEAQLIDAEMVYEAIGENDRAEPKLRAYANSDWGELFAGTAWTKSLGGVKKAISLIERKLSLDQELDTKLIFNHLTLSRVLIPLGKWEESEIHLKKIQEFFLDRDDTYGIARTWGLFRDWFVQRGEWLNAMKAQESGLAILPKIAEHSTLKANLLGSWAVGWIWAGRYAEAEYNLESAIALVEQMGEIDLTAFFRDLSLVKGMEGKYKESEDCFARENQITNHLDAKVHEHNQGIALGFKGIVMLRQGELTKAEEFLSSSITIKDQFQDSSGALESLVWLAYLYEIQGKEAEAESCYRQCLDLHWTGRRYFECAALAGLIRVKNAQGEYDAIPPLLTETEQLAQQYEYNDFFTSLFLIRGDITWDGLIPEWESGFDSALHLYQLALIHALRYNRFLLDEALSGGEQSTPLRPIIQQCLERGKEGQRMLFALRDWWQSGVNEIGTPRPDTISPIPEGLSLLEAERIARQREPGDGSFQKSIVEQINAVLEFCG